MNSSFLKRRYFDIRLGGTMISPLIQMANFVAIMFLYVRHIIPVEIFAPLFFFLGFFALATVGVKFRKYQASTDYDLLYEKQRQQANTLYEIMNSIKTGKCDKNFDHQMEYLFKIAEGRI